MLRASHFKHLYLSLYYFIVLYSSNLYKAQLLNVEDNVGVGVGGNAECFLLCVCWYLGATPGVVREQFGLEDDVQGLTLIMTAQVVTQTGLWPPVEVVLFSQLQVGLYLILDWILYRHPRKTETIRNIFQLSSGSTFSSEDRSFILRAYFIDSRCRGWYFPNRFFHSLKWVLSTDLLCQDTSYVFSISVWYVSNAWYFLRIKIFGLL